MFSCSAGRRMRYIFPHSAVYLIGRTLLPADPASVRRRTRAGFMQGVRCIGLCGLFAPADICRRQRRSLFRNPAGFSESGEGVLPAQIFKRKFEKVLDKTEEGVYTNCTTRHSTAPAVPKRALRRKREEKARCTGGVLPWITGNSDGLS